MLSLPDRRESSAMTVMTPPVSPTIRLSGAGRIPATPASEIEVTGTLLWNGNVTTTVEYVEQQGRQILVIHRKNSTGVTVATTMTAHRSVAYYSTDEALERGLREIGDVENVENVEATHLYDHIGRQISTPDGWHVLAAVREHATGVEAVIAGALHNVKLHRGQFVGVYGERVSVEPCGCLTLNVEVVGHHPQCKRSEPINLAGPRGWEYISDGSTLLGCKGCRYRWNKAGHYELVLTGTSDSCPYHGVEDWED